jgi:hypothetical protein
MSAATHVTRLFALGGAIVALTVAPAISSAAPQSEAPLKVAWAVVRATDAAPIIETHDGRVIDGHAAYVSYIDRRVRITAAYLGGKLAQGTVGSTLYAASGACFKREPLAGSATLSRIATDLMPLPSGTQRVRYARRGRDLRWREPADRQHSAERGVVAFNARGRIVRSRRASYTDGRRTVDGETIVLSYPSQLPRFVPTSVPRPVCKSRAEPNTKKFAPEGGENDRSQAS